MIKQESKLLSAPCTLLLLRRQIALSIVVLTICLGIIKPEQLFAATEFTLNPKDRIEGIMGAGSVNRIQVSGSEIIEVVGDESKYSIYWSGDWRNLFITPKTEVGETVNLSLILVDGQAQDFRFTVGDVEAQTIFLRSNNNMASKGANISASSITSALYLPYSNSFEYLSLNKELKKEIASMMRAMLEGSKSKYYVNENKRPLSKNKGMLITQSKSYRYKDLSGAILNIKNLTSKPITLEEHYISNLFKDTIAINLSAVLLPAKTKVAAYVITKNNRNER